MRVNLTEIEKTLSFGNNKFSIKTCMALGLQVKPEGVDAKFATSAYMKIRRDVKENWPYTLTALVIFLLIVAIIVIIMKRTRVIKELAANREKLKKTKDRQRKSHMELDQSDSRLRKLDPEKLKQVIYSRKSQMRLPQRNARPRDIDQEKIQRVIYNKKSATGSQYLNSPSVLDNSIILP